VADFAGGGVAGLVRADVVRAKSFLETACSVGDSRSCEAAQWLAAPPPSAGDIDDLRAWLVRQHAGSSPGLQPPDYRALCVAVAQDGSSEGSDPSPGLMEQLSDLHWVHPVSWCRERRQGSILSLGRVAGPSAWPPGPGISTWLISYSWQGWINSGAGRYERSGAGWKRSPLKAAVQAPPAPTPDLAAERRRVKNEVSSFAAAWNRGDEALPHGFPGHPSDVPKREHTRLVVDVEAIRPGRDSQTWALDAVLRGTFAPARGVRWPVEPWKQGGARSPIILGLIRTAGWWREGRWTLSYVAPWTPRPIP
jgi:hypothetical protein